MQRRGVRLHVRLRERVAAHLQQGVLHRLLDPQRAAAVLGLAGHGRGHGQLVRGIEVRSCTRRWSYVVEVAALVRPGQVSSSLLTYGNLPIFASQAQKFLFGPPTPPPSHGPACLRN